MSKAAASPLDAARHDPLNDDRLTRLHLENAALRTENAALRAELGQVEPLVGAALLAATAFRLRDEDGLSDALRRLVQALVPFEDHPAPA